MSRFRKLSQTIWHCQYHIVWVPISYCMGTKYRYRVLNGEATSDIEDGIRTLSEQKECEMLELKVQIKNAHLLMMITPKIQYPIQWEW